MRTVLVAGGAGFLGSHLCDRLLERGDQVLCVDDHSSSDGNNLAALLGQNRFTFIHHDVVQPFGQLPKIDEIYNLASPASPPHYQIDPVRTLLTNVLGSRNLLEVARRFGAKIFQASTSEIYGDPLEHPQTESYRGHVNPIGPRACYDEGKRAAETLFFDYHRCYGLRIRVARIFNTYGPRMQAKDGRVVSNFIVQALSNQPLTVYGEGRQTRSFCYVADLVEGFLRLMEAADTVTGPVNLGNPGEFTILELAEEVMAITQTKTDLVRRPLPQDDPQQRRPDIRLARELLDWTPKIKLPEGLAKTVAYFRQHVTEKTQ